MAPKAHSPVRSFGFRGEEEVLKYVRDPAHNIEFIRVMFPDILGRPMDFTFPKEELERSFQEGKGFDGSSVEGFVRIEESDLVIRPDARTFRVLPWEYVGFQPDIRWREAVLFGEIITPEGKPYESDTRRILKDALKKARTAPGIDGFKVGPELEFFIFPSNKDARPLDEGGYFFAGLHGEIRKEIQLLLKRMGIVSEYDHHEVAHGQHEIDLRFDDALVMADTVMLFRYMAKRVARMHGLYATFMPKPINGQNGSGMHVHQSLWSRGRNLFFDPKDRYHLSAAARHYVAGLMAHAGEISSVLSQWVNSYKRLIEGYEAPVYIAWGQRNRSAYIRVPRYQPGKEHATRIELRSPDPGCNLYLALSVMLAAGLRGVRDRLPLAEPVEENIYHMSNSRQKHFEIKTLPRNLEEAVKLTEKSDLVRETLGSSLFEKFLANKRQEILEYNRCVSGEFDKQVSDYELRKYLPFL
ncbi:MAG: glutamine synthetase [Candidatus Aminicenantes bacterium RBG_13_63_10]|nr:MAG: glutamine synthetase [Candidatus Aminicenantes bacterium RBG_13_63_10]